MTNRLELNWKLDGFIDEQRYYCSETPIDPENLPVPKAIIAGDARTYTDTAIEVGKTYYVAVSSVKGGIEKISQEVEILTGGDEHWDKVVALLHFDGDLVDETGRVWSRLGTANVTTLTSRFGDGCFEKQGQTGGLRTAHMLQNESFTVELFVFIPPHVETGIISVLSQRQDSSGSIVTPRWELVVRTSGVAPTPDEFYLAGYNISQSPENVFSTKPVPIGVWTHIAYVYDSAAGVVRFFVDGELAGSYSRNYPNASSTMTAFGYFNSSSLAERSVDVLFDELRITKGIARYTANFTPPTEPFPDN